VLNSKGAGVGQQKGGERWLKKGQDRENEAGITDFEDGHKWVKVMLSARVKEQTNPKHLRLKILC